MTTNDTTTVAVGDALKYAAALLTSCTDWACDSIGGSMCEHDHELELDAIGDTVKEIGALAAQVGDPRRYSDGRRVQSSAEIQRGLITSHVWKPDPATEETRSWRSALPSDPGVPSPGVYEVTLDPATQDIHIRVVRTA
jgi:hypothetical protein